MKIFLSWSGSHSKAVAEALNIRLKRVIQAVKPFYSPEIEKGAKWSLEVGNARGRLAPGIFSEVIWPTRRPRPSLFVPPAAIATTTERSFVIRVRDGVTEWVDVKRGASMNQQGVDLVEVFGELAAGEQIAARGTDELRAGTRVQVKAANQPQGKP